MDFINAVFPLYSNVANGMQNNINAAIDESLQTSGPKPPPPASKRAIRQLPIVKVTPEDLVDENNRECCICLEP